MVWWGMAALAAAFLLALSGCGRNKPVVKVGDQMITRDQFTQELDRQYGRAVMEQMISDAENEQYAKKIGVMPTDEEIKAEEDAAKKATPDLDQSLKNAKRTMEDWRIEVRKEMISRLILTKGIKATPDEVKKFYDDMMTKKQTPYYRYGTIGLLVMPFNSKDVADKAYKALKDGAGWKQVAETYLADNPDAVKSVQQVHTFLYDGGVMFTVIQNQARRVFPEPYNAQIMNTPTGSITGPINLPANSWLIVKVTDKSAARTMSLADAKYIAQSQAELQKAMTSGKAAEQQKALQKFKDGLNVQPYDDSFSYLKQTPKGGETAAAKPKAKG